jgi:hypothetical protein
MTSLSSPCLSPLSSADIPATVLARADEVIE